MLAIIILVGIFYLALNCTEKYQHLHPKSSMPASRCKSFKDNERRLRDASDVLARCDMSY